MFAKVLWGTTIFWENYDIVIDIYFAWRSQFSKSWVLCFGIACRLRLTAMCCLFSWMWLVYKTLLLMSTHCKRSDQWVFKQKEMSLPLCYSYKHCYQIKSCLSKIIVISRLAVSCWKQAIFFRLPNTETISKAYRALVTMVVSILLCRYFVIFQIFLRFTWL